MRPMHRALIACSFLLAVTACGNEPEAPAAEETAIPVEPDGGIGDGAGPPDVEATLANRIPTRFQGTWDHVEGTCSPDSDLRMEIGGAEILFYESVGTVTDVTSQGDDVIVTLAMEGEGETWGQKTRLSLVGEGSAQRLETTDGEQPETEDAYPSKRCTE